MNEEGNQSRTLSMHLHWCVGNTSNVVQLQATQQPFVSRAVLKTFLASLIRKQHEDAQSIHVGWDASIVQDNYIMCQV